MATVYFLYRSIRKNAPLTVRLQVFDKDNNKFQFEAKTSLFVDKHYWEVTRHKKRNVDAEDKKQISEVNDELSKIENFVLKCYSSELPNPSNKEWLKEKVYTYYNPKNDNEYISDVLTDCIQNVIDTANTRENNQKGFGLSKSRINSYKNLLKIIKTYQKGKKTIRIKDIDIRFGKAFLNWMLNKQNYSESYARKKLDDIKTVCRDAEIYGIEVSKQITKVKGGKPKTDFIVYLSPEELLQIENTTLLSEAHQNTRTWLLLGCHIGQRGSDLLKINKSNFVTRQGLKFIELKQQKTGKHVTIPILEKTEEILKNGLPYPIAIQNFNTYIKEICKIAGIDKMIEGTKVMMLDENGNEIPKDKNGKYVKKGVKRTVKGIYPKYELVTSHVCRRSFATNLYGIMSTALIMKITAHSTEKMLLQYIGKNSLDYAQQIADFYELQKLKKVKQPKLEVVRHTS